jgi:hypothetical protein
MGTRAALQGAIRILGFEPRRAKHLLSHPLEFEISIFCLKSALLARSMLKGT